MSDQPDPRFVEAMRDAFLDVPFHRLVGLDVIDVGSPGRATMAIPIGENTVGKTGNLHGGAVALLCDLACAAAATTSVTYDHATTALVTSDIHIRYVGSPKGTRVQAAANVVKAGRTLVVVQANVTDDLGNLIAVADFSAALVTRKPG